MTGRPPAAVVPSGGCFDPSVMLLPRDIDAAEGVRIMAVLRSHPVVLREGGMCPVPSLDLSEPLKRALLAVRRSGRLVRGLAAAAELLENERRGIEKVRENDPHSGTARLSRILCVATDGSDRFYRQVEELSGRHFPRLLVCRVEADSAVLGWAIYGPDAVAKAVMVNHRDAVSRVLRSLAAAPE